MRCARVTLHTVQYLTCFHCMRARFAAENSVLAELCRKPSNVAYLPDFDKFFIERACHAMMKLFVIFAYRKTEQRNARYRAKTTSKTAQNRHFTHYNSSIHAANAGLTAERAGGAEARPRMLALLPISRTGTECVGSPAIRGRDIECSSTCRRVSSRGVRVAAALLR